VGEPIAVAFVEVVPETAAFKAQAEAQIRSQLAATRVAVPPTSTTQNVGALNRLSEAAGETATAESLLTAAQERYNAALVAGQGLNSAAARGHVQKAAATEADAAAQRALFAITDATTAATVAEIDALVQATGALAAKAAAEERAVFATRTHAAASVEATEAILAETATMTGLRGASLGVNPAFLAATAAAIGFFKSADEASQFDEQMHLIEASTHASEEEMARASDTSKQLGADLNLPATSALDAAKAIADLTRAGFDLADSQTLAREALVLSAATEQNIGDSTDQLTRLLRAYNLEASDAQDVTDALTAAQLSGAGSASDFASGLTAVAPVAHTLGLSVRDTATFIIQMAHAGISASQSGTLLRQSLLKLAGGSTPVREGLKKIHLELSDLIDETGNLRPDAFVVLSDALDHLNVRQQRQVLTQIFSIRGIRAVLPLIQQQRAGYEQAAASADKLGLAQEQAEARAKAFHGQTRELRKELSDFGVELGELTVGPLTAFVKFLRNAVREEKDALDNATALAHGVGALGGAITGIIPGGDRAAGVLTKLFKFQTGGPLVFVREFNLASDGVRRFGDAVGIGGDKVQNIAQEMGQARTDVANLFGAFRTQGGGLTALNELVLGLQAVRKGLDETTPAGKRAAEQIDEIIRKVQNTGQLPPVPIQFGITFDEEAAAEKAHKAGDTVTEGLIRAGQLGFPALANLGLDMLGAITGGIDSGDKKVEESARHLIKAFIRGLNAEAGGTLDTQAAVTEATGGNLLSIRQRQLAEAQRALTEARALPQGKGRDTAVHKAADIVNQRRADVESILADQESSAQEAARTAQEHADKIKTAQEARDQSIVDALSSEQQRREARISAAGATAGVADDIKANDALRDFLRRGIAEVQARIAEVRRQGRSTKQLRDELQNLRLGKAAVRREIARLRAERRQEADQNRIESTQLDVELAGIGADAGSDNRTQASINREVSARQRLIAALRKAQAHVKRGTVEWKRLRNQIAEEQAAIAELKKQNSKKQGDVLALKKQEFDFLQTMAGFTTNLIGNLIPGMNTSGLVGGSTPNASTAAAIGANRPAGAGTRPTAGISVRPVSTAQGNTQISLLREIRNQLHKLNSGQDHPEAHRQRKTSSASGDFSYQGTHGM
jgi:TP901 family phage tail tape measure protein